LWFVAPKSENHPAAGKDSQMSWTVVPFGKYKGKTLPEIIVLDPDWFFWMLPNFYGKLAKEAEDLARKARAIKIPKGKGKKLQVEYQYDIDGRFYGFEFVEARSWQYRWSLRLPHVDLAWPLRGKKYNKRAGRITIRDFRQLFFGEDKRLTKKRCERFFSNDKNFLC
jgi:hypothetical protein